MVILRTNVKSPTSGQDCFKAMQRHAAAKTLPVATPAAVQRIPISAAAGDGGSSPPPGADILYGATAIAAYLFGDSGTKARRRVFNLWSHYSKRKERAGFFKLKGAVCLSKKQWLAFHGLE